MSIREDRINSCFLLGIIRAHDKAAFARGKGVRPTAAEITTSILRELEANNIRLVLGKAK